MALAARHRLPAIYSFRPIVAGGGLISYGPHSANLSVGRRPTSTASSRVRNRPIFRVQPTKFELVINLKTAKALGLEYRGLLARADEVIE